MKWWPKECEPGDMIRVNLGSIWHYGIFVSESEIVQFGLPPISRYKLPDNEVRVCTSDIDVFSCGKIIEVCIPEKKEIKLRNSAEKTIETARSRIGEDGYSLIHNNCEHFANECYFGIKRSLQHENALNKWISRPILDVYIYRNDSEIKSVAIDCRKILRELNRTEDETEKRKLSCTLNMLEYAAQRSFNLKTEEVSYKYSKRNGLTCKKFSISTASKDDFSLLALSNSEVNVSVGRDIPENKTDCDGSSVIIKTVEIDGELIRIFVAGENINSCKVYFYDGHIARLVNTVDGREAGT